MKAMKNYIARTFILTLLVVVVLLGLYFVPTPTVDGYTLRRVNMLADIEAEEPEEEPLDTVVLPPPVKPAFVDTCKTGLTCIEDYADSTQRGMKPFYEALDHADERPVRIAYFGDSFIEADILTGDLRDMLQARFGGCGVGYVDITSGTYGFRKTLRHSFAGWTSKGVNDSTGYDRKRIGPSGHYFIPHWGAYVEARPPKAHRGQLDSCEVATIYFEATDTVLLATRVNGIDGDTGPLAGKGQMQAVEREGLIKSMRWTVEKADSATFYGFALDGRTGITVDNFGVRSSSGLTLASIPQERLRQFGKVRPYDLIVLQFGLNVATERGRDYSWYETGMLRVIQHMKEAFPEAGILVVSVGDREYKDEEGRLRTMPGVKNLIRYQQNIAAKGAVAFWNLYDAMGGEGSIRRMVEAKPAQANLDYTHINFLGGRTLARHLYETLIYGKEQYDKRRAYEND